jgi:diguanylate cyclase (GGDEF)-like protein
MYCRVLDSPQRGKQSNTIENQVIGHIKELEKQSLLAGTEAYIGTGNGEEIEKLALSDNLTELYNSRTFLKKLKSEVKRSRRYKRPVAVCLIAVDKLKDLELQYDALTTDAILKIVAQVVQSTIREVDIAARYSGNQFGIILPETNTSGCQIVADRIRQRIAVQAITHNWQNLRITASVGLSSFPTGAREEEELISKALQALERAILEGGNTVCSA